MSYEYERAVAAGDALRLHLNENTAGCSPGVIAALQTLTRQSVAIYPDYETVVAACAARLGVQPERLLLTNGLDDGILATAVSALRNSPAEEPFEAIVVVPAFDMYAACADSAGGRVVEVPLGPEFVFPVREVIQAVTTRTRAIFLTNPNNPTGGLIPRQDIVSIARAASKALVFVDEAYGDFSGETLIGDPAFLTLTNVVVGRTFAKAYGLAGLRAGALVAHRKPSRRSAGRFRRTRSTSPRPWRSRRPSKTSPTTSGTSRRCANRVGCCAQRSTAWTSNTGRAPRTSCSRGLGRISSG